MKRRVDPRTLAAFRLRGDPGEPEGLRCYRLGEHGNGSTLGPYPHGRFCLVIALECPRLRARVREDMQVGRFYRGVLPWLRAGWLAPESRQRWIDLVNLLDELMDREDTHFDAETPWPLTDVHAVFSEALTHLQEDADPEREDADLGARAREEIAAFVAMFNAHAMCCDEALINVHWW